jgi:prevent-host-death family protein
MTIHVNIGEAKTRLSELVAACERGETVVLARAGKPVARLVPETEQQAQPKNRMAAFGMFKDAFKGYDVDELPPSMTDEELEERYRRKFGPAA